MAWEENSRICLHMQLIAILSRIGVFLSSHLDIKPYMQACSTDLIAARNRTKCYPNKTNMQKTVF